MENWGLCRDDITEKQLLPLLKALQNDFSQCKIGYDPGKPGSDHSVLQIVTFGDTDPPKQPVQPFGGFWVPSSPMIIPDYPADQQEKKCTCGAASCGSTGHSDWCDLYAK